MSSVDPVYLCLFFALARAGEGRPRSPHHSASAPARRMKMVAGSGVSWGGGGGGGLQSSSSSSSQGGGPGLAGGGMISTGASGSKRAGGRTIFCFGGKTGCAGCGTSSGAVSGARPVSSGGAGMYPAIR